MIKHLLGALLWPLLVGGGMVAVHLAVAAGVAAPAALVTLQVATVAIVATLERWMPEHASWNVAHNDLRTDAIHTLVSGIVVSAVLRTAVFAVVPSLALWPARWTVPVQLVLALFLADLGSYVTHILTHRVAWLWPIHAVHHSARRLYWLNSARMHPLDSASTILFSLLPLALLGVPAPVLALVDAFVIVHLMLQHSNVRLRHGLLNRVIATAEFHRWHHSTRREEGERNYASFFSVWDRLFGTFRMPAGQQPPEQVGLYDAQALPDGWVQQIRHPFHVWASPVSRASERPAG